jgi:hypothetical protein
MLARKLLTLALRFFIFLMYVVGPQVTDIRVEVFFSRVC